MEVIDNSDFIFTTYFEFCKVGIGANQSRISSCKCKYCLGIQWFLSDHIFGSFYDIIVNELNIDLTGGYLSISPDPLTKSWSGCFRITKDRFIDILKKIIFYKSENPSSDCPTFIKSSEVYSIIPLYLTALFSMNQYTIEKNILEKYLPKNVIEDLENISLKIIDYYLFGLQQNQSPFYNLCRVIWYHIINDHDEIIFVFDWFPTAFGKVNQMLDKKPRGISSFKDLQKEGLVIVSN